MDRKEFLAKCGSLCACACAASFIVEPQTALAAVEKSGAPASPPHPDSGRLHSVQEIFASLVAAMDAELDPAKRDALLRAMGKRCAALWGMGERFRGRLDDYLRETKNRGWAEQTEHDPEARTLTHYGKPREHCGCPFVGQTPPSATFCACSLGYMRETLGIILERPIESIDLKESILRGNGRCVFTVKYGDRTATLANSANP